MRAAEACAIHHVPIPIADAGEVLDAIDLGIAVCTADLHRVIFDNDLARTALAAMGARPGEIPACVRDVMTGVATPVTTAAGQRYFVRRRALTGGRVLVSITAAVVRERDLGDVLFRRFGLSHRERQVVNLLRRGMTNQQIADMLALSVATVKAYLTNVFVAIGVKNRLELIAFVERLEL